ncbi:MAG TPA: hypothetical protein VGD65_21505 [Chryseosolibacter sp.]
MLKKSLIAILALGVAISCDRPQASSSLHEVVSKPTTTSTVSNGLFHADSLLSFNFELLAQTFGKQNIVEKVVGSPMEESSYHVVILFPGSPKEIEVVLQDSTAHADVKAVIIGQNSTWTTRAGVKPGMTLKELQVLNGRPFLFYGGGWDQGGYVTNWKDGALHGEINSCRLDRNYVMPYDMSKGDYDAHEFSSDSRDAQNGNPVIEEITLSRF